jgi:hypothetical protein
MRRADNNRVRRPRHLSKAGASASSVKMSAGRSTASWRIRHQNGNAVAMRGIWNLRRATQPTRCFRVPSVLRLPPCPASSSFSGHHVMLQQVRGCILAPDARRQPAVAQPIMRSLRITPAANKGQRGLRQDRCARTQGWRSALTGSWSGGGGQERSLPPCMLGVQASRRQLYHRHGRQSSPRWLLNGNSRTDSHAQHLFSRNILRWHRFTAMRCQQEVKQSLERETETGSKLGCRASGVSSACPEVVIMPDSAACPSVERATAKNSLAGRLAKPSCAGAIHGSMARARQLYESAAHVMHLAPTSARQGG